MGAAGTGIAQDALEIAGATVLLLACTTLFAHRASTVRIGCAAQPVAVACALLPQDAARDHLGVAVIAAALMVIKAVALWLMLPRGESGTPPGIAGWPVVVLAGLSVLVGVFVAREVATGSGAPAPNGLALVLALALIGPLVAAARSTPSMRIAGVLAVESAAALAAVAASPAAAVTEGALALLASAALWAMVRVDRRAPGAT